MCNIILVIPDSGVSVVIVCVVIYLFKWAYCSLFTLLCTYCSYT